MGHVQENTANFIATTTVKAQVVYFGSLKF
jgi:hypothetical protein